MKYNMPIIPRKDVPKQYMKVKKQLFLVQFEYEYYCQGYEWTTETLLVEAKSFDDACYRILDKYQNAKDFQNKTLR